MLQEIQPAYIYFVSAEKFLSFSFNFNLDLMVCVFTKNWAIYKTFVPSLPEFVLTRVARAAGPRLLRLRRIPRLRLRGHRSRVLTSDGGQARVSPVSCL